ncbi:DUF2470 domain-containing protein [Hoyosella sp. G463]|uniref:DUF2470 domain-containing protein n=1 Tax=Lolliginicoccus lacisalsi TaxID=2742202 RepID=A0A927PLL4_9ACTN|nr:DUF2470 domain-containing protein [Lolliginicoccus lacisalsi]MBD8506958.1 DUF2470 domain-containing protein [Lolliginicoccus lacisalsi]
MPQPAPARPLPSTAELVRSALHRASPRAALLAIDGTAPIAASVHGIDENGIALASIDDDSPAHALAWQSGALGVPALLELADTAPLELREPVRSLIWLRGQLTTLDPDDVPAIAARLLDARPDESLLDLGHTTALVRIELHSVVVADSSGAESVPIDDLAAAQPDPFSEHEACWLHHLEHHHPEMLEMIIRKLPASVLRDGRVRPLGLDRFGLRLRIERADHDKDIRIAFPAPVASARELDQALRILMGCPFLNGLRARQP